MPDPPSLSSLTDAELCKRLASPDDAAFLELTARYGRYVGHRLKQMNRSWIREPLLSFATWKVLDLVQRHIASDLQLSLVTDSTLKQLVQNNAITMAVHLWRRQQASPGAHHD